MAADRQAEIAASVAALLALGSMLVALSVTAIVLKGSPGVAALMLMALIWVKAFNTLTAGFQASSAGRTGPDRVVVFYATDHDDAAPRAERLISDAGFDPVRTGTLARTEAGHQEPKGDLYGEEFHHEDAIATVARLRGTPPSGRP